MVKTGLLNPLDAPHHMRAEDEAEFRDGVVLKMPVKKSKGRGAFVDCGLSKVSYWLKETRCTVNVIE